MGKKHTRHGKLRTEQRVGVPGGVAAITIRNAWQYGIQIAVLDKTSELYKWACGYQRPKTPNLRLHGQHLYLFSSDIKVITVLNIPEEVLGEFSEIWNNRKKTMRPRKANKETKTQSKIGRVTNKPGTVPYVTNTSIGKLRIYKSTYNSLRDAGYVTLGDFLGRENNFSDEIIFALSQHGIVPDKKGILRLKGRII